MTPPDLAAETGTAERYVREWLEQQAVTGVLDVENPDAPADERRFVLPAGHDEVLADPEPGEVDWMMYGWSMLHCLPVGIADCNGHGACAATGTVMRPDTLRRYAEEAGFRAVEVLPLENFFFRFYRLHP